MRLLHCAMRSYNPESMAVREPILETSAFPIARCAGCGKTVLTHVALDASGGETRSCVHCDGPVAGEIEWISAEELESTGYYFGQAPARTGGGCSSGGCGSCGVKKG